MADSKLKKEVIYILYIYLYFAKIHVKILKQ